MIDNNSVQRDKKSRLLEITKEVRGIPGKRVIDGNQPKVFYIRNHSRLDPSSAIGVDSSTNIISVFDPAFYGEAVKLSGLYKWLVKEEFTIDKRYAVQEAAI